MVVPSVLVGMLLVACASTCVAAYTGLGFGYTTATLLSGSLTSCGVGSANTADCTGGVASAAWLKRRFASVEDIEFALLPSADRETAFVQMHPLTWGVNVDVFRHFNYTRYATKSSMITQEPRVGWSNFYQDETVPLLSNGDIDPQNLFYGFAARQAVLDGGVAALLMNSPNQPATLSVAGTALPAMRYLRLRNDVRVVVVVLQDSNLDAAEVLADLRAVGLNESAHELPDVIFEVESTTPAAGVATVERDGDVWIVRTFSNSSVVVGMFFDFDVSTGRLSGVRPTILGLNIDPTLRATDPQWAVDQAFLNDLAVAATTNDPVIGTTDAFPAPRVGLVRRCLGGACPLGSLTADALRWSGGGEIAVTSSGQFRGDGWAAGPVHVSDIWNGLPFANFVCTGTFRGLTIWEALNRSAALSTAPSTMKTDFGDRLLQVSGLHVTFYANLTGTRLTAIDVLNASTGVYEPLERLRLYKVVFDDYVARNFDEYVKIFSARYDGEVAWSCSGDTFQLAIQKYMNAVGHAETDELLADRINVQLCDGLAAEACADVAARIMSWRETAATCAEGTYLYAGLATCMPCTAAVRGVVATCPLPTTESSNAVAIAVPVAASLVVLVVCGAVAAWWFRVHRDVRDVDNAPKAAPLTLMFTDIQSSTRLWSVAPASMAAALDAHHQLIRKCLVRHGGYEVKTVGDSFMIAVREASAAVAIAVDIQREFQRYRFPRAIRAIYEATDEGIDEIDDDPEALDDLHPLWNGLRVRIGIHTGDAGIVFDEVSKGYDYYGPHVNVAARVEASACGGQIHATEAALANLPTREDVVYVHLGARELRGVSDPVVLWEIIPTELRARDFSAQKVRQEDSAAAHEKAAPLLPHLPPQHAADCVSQASHGSSSALRVDDVSFQTAGVKLFIAVTLLALRMFPRKQQLDIARDIAIAWRLRPAELVACEAPSDYLARVGRRVDTTVIKYMRASAADGTSPMEAAPVANPLAQSLKHSPALTPQIQYIRSSASAAETTVLEV